MWKLVEPIRGVNLSKNLFAWMQTSVFWMHRIPILADIFVFSYPVYLLALYIYGVIKSSTLKGTPSFKKGGQDWLYHKVAAMYIAAGVGCSVLINIWIQFFVDKVRPNVVLGLADFKQETILHQFLPSASFPSDHAAVSMSIAIMSLLRGIQHKDKKFLRFGGILIIFSLITSFARVASGVHRPTDIIGGSIVGILVPLLLMWRPVYKFGTKVAEKIGKVI